MKPDGSRRIAKHTTCGDAIPDLVRRVRVADLEQAGIVPVYRTMRLQHCRPAEIGVEAVRKLNAFQRESRLEKEVIVESHKDDFGSDHADQSSICVSPSVDAAILKGPQKLANQTGEMRADLRNPVATPLGTNPTGADSRVLVRSLEQAEDIFDIRILGVFVSEREVVTLNEVVNSPQVALLAVRPSPTTHLAHQLVGYR